MAEAPRLAFRRARRDDVAAIVSLLADDFLGATREELGPPLPGSYYAAFDAIEADRNNELIVGEAAGRVVAVLQLTYIPYLSFRGSWRAQVESVHVAAELRGRGAGTALMREGVGRARTRGCRLVQLTTDKRRPEARRFYEKLGFQATHEGMKLFLEER
jgi:ribosomal protein S18 acetylase RimI-like enzyme